MYEFKEVVLKNDAVERTILVIEFDDPKYAIVGEFLMSDASLLNYSILKEIDNVLTGEVETYSTSGNRCSLEINQQTTLMEDLLEDMFDDFEAYEAIEIPTEELKELILVWKEKSELFRSSVLEKIEVDIDLKLYNEAMEEHRNSPNDITFNEMMKELDQD